MQHWQVDTGSADETRSLGRLFGEHAVAGLVVLLNGDLGAGKTCFSQGVASGLGVPEDSPVTSPTYTLLNIHFGRFPLYHFDLYRLARVDDLADLGYDEFAEGDGLTLVEWADRMTEALSASMVISIDHVTEHQRKLCFEAFDHQGEEVLRQIAERWHLSSKPV